MVGETEWTGEESDQALVEATGRAGNVIHVAEAASAGLVDPSRAVAASLDDVPGANRPFTVDRCVERRPQMTPPFPALARVSRAIGHSLVVYDADGPLRRVVPFVRVTTTAVARETEHVVPSLPLAAMMMADGLAAEAVAVGGGALSFGGHPIPLVTERIPITRAAGSGLPRSAPWRGPTRRATALRVSRPTASTPCSTRSSSCWSRSSPSCRPKPSAEKSSSSALPPRACADVFVTPFAEGRMPGAEVHANVLDAWRAGRARAALGWARRAGGNRSALVVGGAGAVASAWLTGGAALVLALGYVWLNVRQFAAGSWWPLAVPLTAVLMAFVGDLAWQYFVEGREKRQVKRLFSRYVSRTSTNSAGRSDARRTRRHASRT